MSERWDTVEGFAALRRLITGYAAAQAEQRRTGRESDAAEVARSRGGASIAEDLLLDARAAEAKAAWIAARGQVFRFAVELCLIGDEFRKEDGSMSVSKLDAAAKKIGEAATAPVPETASPLITHLRKPWGLMLAGTRVAASQLWEGMTLEPLPKSNYQFTLTARRDSGEWEGIYAEDSGRSYKGSYPEQCLAGWYLIGDFKGETLKP